MARRSRRVTERDIEPDKPLTRLRTTIVNQEGAVVLDGTALVWTEPL